MILRVAQLFHQIRRFRLLLKRIKTLKFGEIKAEPCRSRNLKFDMCMACFCTQQDPPQSTTTKFEFWKQIVIASVRKKRHLIPERWRR